MNMVKLANCALRKRMRRGGIAFPPMDKSLAAIDIDAFALIPVSNFVSVSGYRLFTDRRLFTNSRFLTERGLLTHRGLFTHRV